MAWPLAARAQQQPERMRRIGFWAGEPETDPGPQRRVAAFKQGLAELGWIEGRTVQIEYRWPIIDGERVRADAESLVALAPDVIVTTGAPTVAVFKRLTRTIPIVFTFVTRSGPLYSTSILSDYVTLGIRCSLTRSPTAAMFGRLDFRRRSPHGRHEAAGLHCSGRRRGPAVADCGACAASGQTADHRVPRHGSCGVAWHAE